MALTSFRYTHQKDGMDMTDRSDVVRKLVEGEKNCTVRTGVPIPKVSYRTVAKNRMTCRTNGCGYYNSSWTCPPNCGTAEYCIERINSYRDSDVIMKKYENVNFSDHDGVQRMMDGFRDLCRNVMIGCRKEGFDVMVFADGPCSYCKECAFKKGKNCYHPDMQVPSVSGYGIDMTSYLAEIDVRFGFSKDSVTLYGIVLFK